MILYFGNMLSGHSSTISISEKLIPKLSKKYTIISSSNKKNRIIRMCDMIIFFLKNYKKTNLVIIDVYSGWAFYYSLIISTLSNIFKVPYFTILHGGNLKHRLDKYKKFSKLVFKNSNKIISPSIYLKKVFEQHNYKVIYIPNFINLKKYKCKIRDKIKPKILWVRAFHKVYNPEMAINVAFEIKKKYNDVELCMVGPDNDGSLVKCKKICKELGLEENVIFTGLLTQKEWILLSTSYDIFINTTNIDNMPVSIIEAMALGFPIVSTNVGGLSLFLKNNIDSLLVEKKSVKEMVSKILLLLENNKKCKELSINSRTSAEQFSWYQIQKLWIKEINDTV